MNIIQFLQMKKRALLSLRIFSIVVIIACILWGMRTSPIELYPSPMIPAPSETGWSQIVDGEAVSLDTVQAFAHVQAGEAIVLEKTLGKMHNSSVLMFSTRHQEVRVFLDDILLYEFVMQEGYKFLKTPGNEWHQVFLDETMSGAVLRVELTSQFKYYSNLMCDFYFLHESQMLDVQIGALWVRAATGAFLVVIAILSYVNGGIWRGTTTRRYVILLGDFYMVIALWVFANAGSFDILFRRPIISYLIEMLALRITPIIAYAFVRNIVSRPYRLITGMGWLVCADLIVDVILQFCFGVSFLHTLWVVHLILVCGVLVDFCVIFMHLHRTRYAKNERNYLFVCTGIMFASALGEVWRYYLMPGRDYLVSVYIAIGYVVYTMIAHVVLVHRNAGLDRSKEVLETNYNKLQNTTLMRQINAHFFFNVLNTISAMCKEDPRKADKAVNLLAKYMRHYMYFINTRTTIRFANELDLIRVYLRLEQMRFGEDFVAEIDDSFTDFEVPPLTIQPIIENAVVHGLRQKNQVGRVTVSSKRVNNYAVITIYDNGAGFDMKTLGEKECLAIDNMRTRLATMVNGTMEIESRVGRGTIVRVSVPLQKV